MINLCELNATHCNRSSVYLRCVFSLRQPLIIFYVSDILIRIMLSTQKATASIKICQHVYIIMLLRRGVLCTMIIPR